MSLVSFFMVSSFRGPRMGVLLDMPSYWMSKRAAGRKGAQQAMCPAMRT
jgi:hypothetical protein